MRDLPAWTMRLAPVGRCAVMQKFRTLRPQFQAPWVTCLEAAFVVDENDVDHDGCDAARIQRGNEPVRGLEHACDVDHARLMVESREPAAWVRTSASP